MQRLKVGAGQRQQVRETSLDPCARKNTCCFELLPRVNVSIESLDAGSFFILQYVHVVAEDSHGEQDEEDWANGDGSSWRCR